MIHIFLVKYIYTHTRDMNELTSQTNEPVEL